MLSNSRHPYLSLHAFLTFDPFYIPLPQYREVLSTASGVQEEDVMSTFDPYGTNLYKGMRVLNDQGQENVETMAKKGEIVGFKKRKKAGSSSAAEEGGRVGAGKGEGGGGGVVARSSASCQVPASRGPGPGTGINTEINIKIERGAMDSNAQPAAIDTIYIKQEIKIEPVIKLEDPEPDLPPAKMTFGFKNRNMR